MSPSSESNNFDLSLTSLTICNPCSVHLLPTPPLALFRYLGVMTGNTNDELRSFQAQLVKEMLGQSLRLPVPAATAPPPPPLPLPPVKDKWLGTVDAKARYFLGTEDLALIPYGDVQFIPRGFGAGTGSRWYRESAIKRQAILKHGTEEFERRWLLARNENRASKSERKTLLLLRNGCAKKRPPHRKSRHLLLNVNNSRSFALLFFVSVERV